LDVWPYINVFGKWPHFIAPYLGIAMFCPNMVKLSTIYFLLLPLRIMTILMKMLIVFM